MSMSTLKKLFSRQVRKYLYLVSIAAFPVLVYYSVIDPEALPLMLPLIAAVLNLSPEEQGAPEVD